MSSDSSKSVFLQQSKVIEIRDQVFSSRTRTERHARGSVTFSQLSINLHSAHITWIVSSTKIARMPSPAALSASEEEYQTLEATLLNTHGDVPLAKRFRALFTLRNLKTRRAIDIIGKGMSACPLP